MNKKTKTHITLERMFHTALESLYYAVKALNSEMVESDLSRPQKIAVFILSSPLGEIPYIGDAVKSGFIEFCKYSLIGKKVENFEINLLYPNHEQFKTYTEIMYKTIECSLKLKQKPVRKNVTSYQMQKAMRQFSKLIRNEFLKFCSEYNMDDAWDNLNNNLKRNLSEQIEKGNISAEKGKFVLYSYAFFIITKDKLNTFLQKKNLPYKFNISQQCIIKHLEEFTQIKTKDEKQDDLLRQLILRISQQQSYGLKQTTVNYPTDADNKQDYPLSDYKMSQIVNDMQSQSNKVEKQEHSLSKSQAFGLETGLKTGLEPSSELRDVSIQSIHDLPRQIACC